jgi:hypothetical protein
MRLSLSQRMIIVSCPNYIIILLLWYSALYFKLKYDKQFRFEHI